MSQGKIEVVTPIGRVRAETPRGPTPRPEDFRGKVLGLLDTLKPNTDVFMDRVQERLMAADLGFASVIRRRKPTIANEPTPRGIIAELAGRCSVVVHGIGD